MVNCVVKSNACINCNDTQYLNAEYNIFTKHINEVFKERGKS